MVQKRSVKAPGGAEVRRSTNRLTCEAADQGQKHSISTAMRKTEQRGRGRKALKLPWATSRFLGMSEDGQEISNL
ncbi:hypothetical protein N7493_007286 [Penicillium malachiteum]|uniref:Uncharacterized protein n=1 Tax=Penicillium malachiteum TaxID=1324776 RepID=A0AAD6MUN4_9EURO|nr:hypothetical protein N7493_007286 [Penicillium malachiteum]